MACPTLRAIDTTYAPHRLAMYARTSARFQAEVMHQRWGLDGDAALPTRAFGQPPNSQLLTWAIRAGRMMSIF